MFCQFLQLDVWSEFVFCSCFSSMSDWCLVLVHLIYIRTPYFSIELLPVVGWEASCIARPQLITSAIILLFAVPEQAGEQQVVIFAKRSWPN